MCAMKVDLSAEPVFPISEISPYHQQWTIKARATSKGPTRTFNGRNGAGKVFSVDLLDAEGGEVRCNFFNEAVDKYDKVLETGKVYRLTGGSVKIANKQYNSTNNRYELNFDRGAVVQKVDDDAGIGSIRFNFCDLRALQNKTLPCNVDLCGVVKEFKESASITSKAGAELVKRDLLICDDTGFSMTLTLWGDEARRKDSEFEGSPVIAVKGTKVSDFNERSASTLNSSHVKINPPDLKEAQRLREWWTKGGSSAELQALSQQRAIGGARANVQELDLAEVRAKAEAVGQQPEFYSTVARLRLVQTQKQGEKVPLYYHACTEKREGSNGLLCNKRCDENGFCPLHQKTVTTAVRLITRCQFTDHSDSLWLGTFDNGAQAVLGKTGSEIEAMDKAGEKLQSFLQTKYYAAPFKLTLRSKMEQYNGEYRSSTQCVDARPLSLAEHGKQLLGEIATMTR